MICLNDPLCSAIGQNMNYQDLIKCMKKKSSDNSDRINQNISIL